jgi:hypothetical protein
MDVIINESTSVIQIDGSVLALPTVYISTTTLTDHFATVVDMTGYVTAANPLHLSTTDATFSDGTTDAYIRQPFGYLSLAAISSNKWSIVNRDPFSVKARPILALDALTINTATLSTTLISSIAFSGDYLTINSVVAQTAATGNPYTTVKAINVSSTLQTGPIQASTVQSATASILDASGLAARIVGNVTLGRSINTHTANANSITAYSLYVSSLSTSTDTGATIDLLGITARSTITSTLIATNLYFKSTSIILEQGLYASGFQTPAAAIGTYDAFATQTSTISTSVIDGLVSTIQLGSAAILNPFGSITLSSIQMNTTNVRDISGANVSTNMMTISSITLNKNDPLPVIFTTATGDSIIVNSSWAISTNALLTSSMNTSTLSVYNLSTQALTGDSVSAFTLSPNLFTVGSALALAGPSFYVPKAPLVASQITASMIQTQALTGKLSGIETIISDTLSTPSISTTYVSTSGVFTQQASTTTIHANNLTLGKQVFVNPSDPYITVESFSEIGMPPYQYATGSGTFNDPFRAFNTLPTLIYISLYNPSDKPLYLNIKIRHTNLPPPNSGLNGGLNAYIDGNLVFSVLNLYEQTLVTSTQLDLNIANYPIQSPNPSTGDSTPYFIWDVQPSAVTTDELIFWVSNNLNAADEAAAPTVDENGGILIRKGILEWPSTIYGTAISNQYNDIETRSLFYTGSLQNVSDPLLKRDLGAADLSACVAAAQIPLHTYEYKPVFASTFQIQDKRRLGILTSELSTAFPKSVTTEKIMGSPTHVASTDQLRYAHLGATKFLIAEVQRLRQKLLDS